LCSRTVHSGIAILILEISKIISKKGGCMKCPKCKEEGIKIVGFAGTCKKCNHTEYLDPFMSKRIEPIDLNRWFDNLNRDIREGRFF
jgi:endogenous inhibitor of DNA gyrase (YacG/DUF329 family)